MDILEFAVDYAVLFDVLVLIVILSFFIERALSVLFESSFFIKWYDPQFKRSEIKKYSEFQVPEPDEESKPLKKKGGIKELITVIISITIVSSFDFDALAIIMKDDCCSELGYFITGLIIAGGSKASIKLFKDTLEFMSSAEMRRKQFHKQNNT